ncbi:hypothetical protein LVJ82_01485 [Vitreoscilla massiliensis]|uniref:Lipoprotein n=1 Tax=Vitreoscilla massiliensis TaxID=1689272 RepID=A0ABY4E5S7_9NEIS|nr:hypothetical protein [Vitreoscilla massiliensis]UOO89688.1 hypothetical protein LVJ82_01485 [Vitreoscilla massiliensis]
MKWLCGLIACMVVLTACSSNKGGPISSHTGRERKAMRVQAVDAPPPVLIAPEQSAQ